MHSSSLVDAASRASSSASLPLSRLHQGARGEVLGVREVEDAAASHLAGQSAAEIHEEFLMIGRRLAEVGFVPGERFEIVAEARPGGDPIAVRVGGSIFALRRREADMVLVLPDAAA